MGVGKRGAGSGVCGWIALYKEPGVGSTPMVNRVRRLTGAAKAGHGGTLDPFAEGLLPIALGEATKVLGLVLEGDKAYRAWVAFGRETDSGDATGTVCWSGEVLPSREAVAAALPSFEGEIDQVPPSHSALKVDGQRAYDLVRRGEVVVLPSRRVRVDRLALLGYEEGVAELEVRCGKGTYVRAIARDLGRVLGCGGHLIRLIRTETLGMTQAEAVTLAALEGAVADGSWHSFVFPPDRVLADIPVLRLGSESWRRVGHGQRVEVGRQEEGRERGLVRLLTPEGVFAGIGALETSHGVTTVQPQRLFRLDASAAPFTVV